MNCRSSRKWTRLRRDAEPAPQQELAWQTHLAQCASCAEDAGVAERLASLLHAQPVAEPSAQFDWRLKLRLSKLERDGLPPLYDLEPDTSRTARLQFWGAAVAAAIAVVVVGLSALHPRELQTTAGSSSRTPSAEFVGDQRGLVRPIASVQPIGPQQPLPYAYFVVQSPRPDGVDSLSSRPDP